MKRMIIFLLLITVFESTYAMELEETKSTDTMGILSLPNELLTYILPLMSSNLDIMSGSLQELRLVNKKFQQMIDDPQNIWVLIKLLSEKLNLSPLYVAHRLKIPSATNFFDSTSKKIKQYAEIYALLSNKVSRYITSFRFPLLKQGNTIIVPVFFKGALDSSGIYWDPNTPNALLLVRLLPDGLIDRKSGFLEGTTLFVIDPPAAINEPFAFGIDNDSRLLCASTTIRSVKGGGTFEPKLIVFRFNKNGTLDETWADKGNLALSFTQIYNLLTSKGIKLAPSHIALNEDLASLWPQKITIKPDGGVVIYLKMKIMEVGIDVALPLTSSGKLDKSLLKPEMIKTYP
jgi:hypothetical protein